MKTIGMALSGLFVFALAAAAGWYVRTGGPGSSAELPVAQNVDLTADPMDSPESAATNSPLMPVAVRDQAMSVEELLRFSLSLKEREKGLKADEEQFRQRQVRQQLVLSDIQAEEQAVDGLRTQIMKELSAAEGMIQDLNRIRDGVIAERERTKEELSEMESKQIEISEQHKVNDKKLSTWLQGMTSEKAAALLTEMANNGEMDVAVQLLANLEEREAAKILDSIPDTKLLNDFITAFRNLKNSRPSARGNGGTVR